MIPKVRLSPRISEAKPSSAQTGGPAPALGWAVAWCSLCALIGIAFVTTDAPSGFRLIMGGVALVAMAFVPWLVALSLSVKRGVVRIAKAGHLRFLPPATNRVFYILFAVSGLVSGVFIIIVSVFDLPMVGGRLLVSGPIVFGVGGLSLLGSIAWERRKPLGLTLDERGLRGVRESASIDVEWDDIVRVSTLGSPKSRLMVQLRNGGRRVVGGPQIGSDPAVVAAIVEYYRLHPAERIHLSDGPGAIRVVEARSSC